jgi:LPS-assembly lipoprotein
MKRRAILLPILLAGCGFHPIYAPAGGGKAVAGLAEIQVGLIPERRGQLLREDLLARFRRDGEAVARRFDLTVTYTIDGENIGIQRDNTTSRVRLVGIASWALTAQDPKRTQLATGSARQVDGYNVFVNQYFAADMENDAVRRRLTDAIADQITLQLATWFDTQQPK